MSNAPAPLDADAAARSERVIHRLRAAAQGTGFVPFDRFMEIALYEPGIGFYERTRSPLGSRGDFYTAAHVTPLFAAAVAARIREVRAAVPRARPFRIVELGPGDGTLAAGIVQAFGPEAPGFEYVLVDRSTVRRSESEQRVRGAGGMPITTAGSVGALGPFVGVVVANEFLDAQPARRVRWHDGAWHELGVRIRDDRVVAAEEPMARSVSGTGLPTVDSPEGVVEFSDPAEGTIREIGDHLLAGAAILLDYGGTESELWRGRSGGTLSAVRDHRFLADPLDAPGTADLSVFVNFDRVRARAATSGLRELAYRSQAEALGAWGFPGLLDAALRASSSAEERVRIQLAAKNLLFGFERFRVLELAPPGPEASASAPR